MTLLICCLFAILSRNVATARIGRLRTPFGDLQKREEDGLIKEARTPARSLAHLGLRCPCFAWRPLTFAGAAAAVGSILADAAADCDEIGIRSDEVEWGVRERGHGADR